MKEKTMDEWLMLLKTVPDNVFMEFFSDMGIGIIRAMVCKP